MNDQKKYKIHLDPFNWLGDVLKILSEGAAKNRYIAGILIIYIVAVTAVIKTISHYHIKSILFLSTLGMIIVCLFFLFKKGIQSHKKKIQDYATVNNPKKPEKQNMKENNKIRTETISIVNNLKEHEKNNILGALQDRKSVV